MHPNFGEGKPTNPPLSARISNYRKKFSSGNSNWFKLLKKLYQPLFIEWKFKKLKRCFTLLTPGVKYDPYHLLLNFIFMRKLLHTHTHAHTHAYTHTFFRSFEVKLQKRLFKSSSDIFIKPEPIFELFQSSN